METVDCDKSNGGGEEGSQLNRNRSFKSKQLVRSQAIRETHSPPRAASPDIEPNPSNNVTNTVANTVSVMTNNDDVERTLCNEPESRSEMCSDVKSVSDSYNGSDFKVKHPVEIQITGGAWDRSGSRGQRAKRWLGNRDDSTHFLSNNPRVACVCGTCAACPHCRGRRRRHLCPTKQDSGIVCSDDCADCSDSEQTGGSSNDGIRKTVSVDADEQPYFCRCPERREKPKTPSFSRTDSDERSEPDGMDLVNFLKDTLNKNARDRMTLLRIEKELHSLVTDTGRCIVRFPVMTSYGRMLVHRCAALFQLSHHLDQANKTSVLVSKSGTSGGRIPCTAFKEWCTASFPPSPQRAPPDHINAKSILKRSACALEAGLGALGAARSRSLEQRERDYERVRRRIFSSDNCTQDESQWPWMSGPVKLLTPEGGNRNKLLKVQSLEGAGGAAGAGGFGGSGGSWRARGAVAKSHSFGGYAAAEPPPAHPRLLSRQGDLASSSWRLSPSSSGYKTLSLRSTDSVTPSPTGGASPEPTLGAELPVVWAVTDLSAVPPGASVIHPQTGRPLTNPDGSLYRFDPANPPILYNSGAYIQDNKIDLNEKRRGRLEKQHSFNDNVCECQPAEECRGKCYCECRRHDSCHRTVEKHHTQDPKPQSPAKHRYEPPTNQNPEPRQQYEPTNQNPEPRQQYEPTNQKPEYNGRSFDQSRGSDGRGLEQRELREDQDARASGGEEYQYVHSYRAQEQVTATQPNQYVPQEVPTVSVQAMIPQQAVTPVPVQDANIRPVSLTNTMYPAPVHQPYAYMNQCRIDQAMQYQPVIQQAAEEPKVVQPTQHPAENTFRIDPSYPYPAVDYSTCGMCVDTSMQTHRGYSVPYGQMEVPTVLPAAYPVGNMMLPQQHMQSYPYPDVPWAGAPPKLLVPELCPLVPIAHYPAHYPQYNLMYPQVIPQVYPLCQPAYPPGDKLDTRRGSFAGPRPKRHSMPGSARATPQPDPRVSYDEQERRNEIATKIQQIKEQMSQLNMAEAKREDSKARNSGNGILGSCPSAYNGSPGRICNDETQLSTAARAIVNSIRNIQVKQTPMAPPAARAPQREPRAPLHRAPYLLRHMSPGSWTRRSPGPPHQVMNQPRYPHPDSRNGRR